MSENSLITKLLNCIDESVDANRISEFIQSNIDSDSPTDTATLQFIETLPNLPLFKKNGSQDVKDLINSLIQSQANPSFGCFVLSILTRFLDTSPLNRIRVYSEDLIQYLLNAMKSSHGKVRDSLTDLFVSLSELGLSFNQMALLYRESLSDSYCLDVFYRIFQHSPQSVKSLLLTHNSRISFPDVTLHTSDFTLSCWLELHSGFHNVDKETTDSFDWITFNRGEKEVLKYCFEDSKLVLKSTGVAKFDSFQFQLGRLYHVCLIHRLNSKSSAVDLFVDGCFIQTRDFVLDLEAPLEFTLNLCGSNESDNVIPEFVSLMLIEGCQRQFWPLISYSLGPNYSGIYQDVNMAAHIDPKSKIKLKMKLCENCELDFDAEASKQENLTLADNAIVNPGKLGLNFHCLNATNVGSEVRIDIQKHSQVGKVTANPIIIDNNNDIIFWNPTFLIDSLFAIGGVGALLHLVAESSTTSDLVKSLILLFRLLDSDVRSLDEFGSNSGYNVLATLLKTKKELINMDVLTTVLKFIGYNSDSPADSIISNKLAYRALVADFEIWKPEGAATQSAKDTFKFVLFQLSMFGDGSKYHEYNLKRLASMKIVGRIIRALNYGLVDTKMLPILHDSLEILVRQKPTPEVIQQLCLYVIYALKRQQNPKELDEMYGKSMLSIITSIFCESSQLNNFNQCKNFLRCVNAKWLMILLDHDDHYVVLSALRLLVLVLLLLGPGSRRSFNRSGGMAILRRCIGKNWRNCSDLMSLLWAGIFGIKEAAEMNNTHDLMTFVQFVCDKEDLQLVIPELIDIANELVSASIDALNKLIAENPDGIPKYDDTLLDVEGLLNLYLQALRLSIDKSELFAEFLRYNSNWIIDFLLIVEKLQLCCESDPTLDALQHLSSRYMEFFNSHVSETIFDQQASIRYKKFLIHFFEKNLKVSGMVIAPYIFKHMQEFKTISSLPVFNDALNVKPYLALIQCYLECGVQLNVSWLDVILSSLETMKSTCNFASSSAFKNCTSKVVMAFKDSFIESTEAEIINPGSQLQQIKKYCSSLLVHQQFLSDEYNAEQMATIFSLLFKNLLITDKEIVNIVANTVRVISMSQNMPLILSVICGSDGNFMKRTDELFKSAISLDDQKMISQVYSDFDTKERLNAIFNNALNESKKCKRLPAREFVNELIKQWQKNFNDQINTKKWKLESIAEAVVNSEGKKFARHIQDDRDNLEYYSDLYSRITTQIPVLSNVGDWILDTTEGRFRMKKKILFHAKADSCLRLTKNNVISKQQVKDSSPRLVESELDSAGYEFVSDQTSQEDKNRKIIRSLFVHDKITKIMNVTRIQGLEALESLFIIGLNHLYLIGNYFRTIDGEIVDVDEAPVEERDAYIGMISGTHTTDHPVKNWLLTKLMTVSKRKFLLRDVAIELFFVNGDSVLLTLGNKALRNSLFDQLSSKITAKYKDHDLEEAMYLASQQRITSLKSNESITKLSSLLFHTFINTDLAPSDSASFSKITKKWKRGELSNFYYLMLVNTIAGRTFNDFTQYPVFPFVIADYTSKELNLDDPKVFRDLSKPMGAQTDKRAKQFRERYNASSEMVPDVPPAHYGTHYSSAMVVTSYLIRLKPFVNSYLILQGGKFDHADRLFYSIAKTWRSASEETTSDVRELIPEFYYLPEFLINYNGFKFGSLQDGTNISDVQLPPWAHGDAKEFVCKMRQALESDYVSAHLPSWIDLVFGFKQSGQKAVESLNVFDHLSYAGAVDLDKVENQRQKEVITSTIYNFGQTPLQLFTRPHTSRWKHLPRFVFDPKEFSKMPMVTSKVLPNKQRVDQVTFDVRQKEWIPISSFVRLNGNTFIQKYSSCSLIINKSLIFEQLSSNKITRFELLDDRSRFIVGYEDGTMLVYRLTGDPLSGITNSQRSSVQRYKPVACKVNPHQLELQSTAVMRGHSTKIVDIQIAHSSGVILTQSLNGEVMLWNLEDFTRIREVDKKHVSKMIAISDESGYITTLDDDGYLRIFTVNAEFICERRMRDTVTKIVFPVINTSLERKVLNYPWSQLALIAVGFCDGTVEFYELKLTHEWMLNKIGEVKIPGEVSAILLKLGVSLDGEGNKIERGKLMVGNTNGELMQFG